jgi:predicted transposase YbfD/YdcC
LEVDENEITAGLILLAELLLEGTIMTGDAIFAKKSLPTYYRQEGRLFFHFEKYSPS